MNEKKLIEFISVYPELTQSYNTENYIKVDMRYPTGFAVDSTTDPSDPVTYPIEQLYKEKNQVKVRLLIAWKPVIGINRYELRYRKNNTGWRTVELQDPTYSIDDINVPKTKKNQPQIGFVEYDIRVKSISASGKKSKKPLSLNNKKVRGKTIKLVIPCC